MTASEPWPSWATERVEIAPYDPRWQHRGAQHAARLDRLLAPWLVRPVEHVGSTAVPGLAAKPIIDLQAAVADLAVTAEVSAALEPDGWLLVPPDLDQRPWRRFYVLPADDKRDAHLHLMTSDSQRWRAQLVFRDALRADPSLVAEYTHIKRDLADEHAEDREAYTRGKEAFVRRVVKAADAADSD